MKFPFRKGFILSVLMACVVAVAAQRTYKAHSVLAGGVWHKIAVRGAGVYKIDVAFLNALGLTGTLSSAQIKLYGTGGGMLPEANNVPRIDDLQEVAIAVVDGGDGVLNGADYVLFYAPGPHQWHKDSFNKRFYHQKNLYSDQAFYYITLGENGRRITTQTTLSSPIVTTTTFDERYYHELDSVNFLSSGKEWFGEEFSNLPGHVLSRPFSVPAGEVVANSLLTITSRVVARSVTTGSRFEVRINNQPVQQLTVAPISGGIYDVFAQTEQQSATTIINGGGNDLAVLFTYLPGSFNAQGWLDWFEIFYRKNLVLPPGRQLTFRDWNTVGRQAVTFSLRADAGAQVWDVSDLFNPVAMKTTASGGQLTFTNEAQTLHEYIAFSNSFLIPQPVGRMANQDLHNTVESDYFIIMHPLFAAQAERLAQFHRQKNNLRTVVVTTEQVFNEFSGGIPDPAALRDFVKMYYDRYRSTWHQKEKYLLLFGDASFDYKDRIANNTNLVPCYETAASLDPLSTYTSDDFFGFLDDEEDINSNLSAQTLDLGIGRVPAKTAEEAKSFVDKVFAYHTPASFGPWRNNMDFIADDEDQNLHLQDAEVLTATVQATAPVFNLQKIYLDAFKQEGSLAGGRYPQAVEVINNSIYNGTLLWNYSGHGGPFRLAEEVVLDQKTVNNWNNANRLPLIITATCHFAPFDIPTLHSLGEDLLLRPKTGAIALMTTTRVVFSFSNRIVNNNYLRLALQPDSSGQYKTLGAAVQAAKNFTYQTSGDIANTRKFLLLGDPAMTLGFPTGRVTVTSINGQPAGQADTLRTTDNVVLEGAITDQNGGIQNTFAGTVYLSLFDKPQTITTLGNDPGSQPVPFQTQSNILFKGKASVSEGRFRFQFRMPRDINYQYGHGKWSLYAHNDSLDANGFSTHIIIGGIGNNGSTDTEGPVIKAFLNDETFVPGGMVNDQPVLLVKLTDSSGINTGSTGIGHDLVATLDEDNKTYYVLNNFYEADLNEYQKGSIRYQLPTLAPGPHTLKIKAWDVLNNSAEYLLTFTVVASEELVLNSVLNYPNPFISKTSFWFEHNRPGTDLTVTVDIFTVAGRRIKSLRQTINTAGTRSNELEWDARDEYSNKVGRGVYIYQLRIRTADGQNASRWEKLVVL